MTALAAVIDALEPVDGGWRGRIPESWQQGRTAYGGLSSALALTAAMRSEADLPPMRSAQIAFVGPLSGDVTIGARRLRRGRTATWMQADVESQAGLGLTATFVFMGEQPSRLDYRAAAAPDFPPPTADTRTYSGPAAVAFTGNFDVVDCSDGTLAPAEWLRWVRLRERDGLDPVVELVAVADCLPPAALKLAGGPAPISSMTWQIDLLGAPHSDDGWYLLRTDSDHARGGVSSQRMAIWNRAGEAVAAQMQSVALFV